MEIVGRMLYGMRPESPNYERWLKMCYGHNNNPYDIHKFGYTRYSLHRLFVEIGFGEHNIRSFEPFVNNASGEGKDCSGCWEPDENGAVVPCSLNLWGVK